MFVKPVVAGVMIAALGSEAPPQHPHVPEPTNRSPSM
jgi:hypothetical protein